MNCLLIYTLSVCLIAIKHQEEIFKEIWVEKLNKSDQKLIKLIWKNRSENKQTSNSNENETFRERAENKIQPIN